MATRKKSGASKKGGAAKRAGAAVKSGAAKRVGAARRAGAARAGTAMPVAAAGGEAVPFPRRRDEGPEVDNLQEELCDLGYLTRSQKALGPGKFGPLTEDALKRFQRDNFIADSGVYDAETQASVRQLNDGVKRGIEGKVVQGLQNRLVALSIMTRAQMVSGHGKFGPQTEAALVSFQTAHGIMPNGVLTDETYRALIASAPTPTPVTDHGDPTSIDTVLPAEGRGFTHYRREPGGADQVGRAATIRAVMEIAEAWSERRAAPRLQVGDISRRGGGPFPPHGSHRKGVDVDVRPVRNDGREEPVRCDQTQYSHELTKELCQLIRAKVSGVRIFFNDPQLISLGLTVRLAGHDDHLHVRFPG